VQPAVVAEPGILDSPVEKSVKLSLFLPLILAGANEKKYDGGQVPRVVGSMNVKMDTSRKDTGSGGKRSNNLLT